MPGVNPDSSSAALYPPPFSRPDETNGAGAAASAPALPNSIITSAAPADSQPAPFSASTIASLFPSLHRSTSLTANRAALTSSATTATNSSTNPTSTLSPFLSRQLTTSRPSPTSSPATDWRTSVTVEDRILQRQKIRSAYNAHAGASLATLLELVQAVEEELLFAVSGSRLDYFKAAIDYEARLRIKKQQLGLTSAGVAGGVGGAGAGGGVEGGGVKRERQADGEQRSKEATDKKMNEEEEAEEEQEGDEAGGGADAAEADGEPTNKKQRS